VSVRAMSTTTPDRGRQLSAISNGITRLHRDHYGRGATTVRTIMQRNYVMCVLEDIYTPVERTLIDAGREDAVRETRTIFQDTMKAQFVQIVEDALGRKVFRIHVPGLLQPRHVGRDLHPRTRGRRQGARSRASTHGRLPKRSAGLSRRVV